MFIRSQRLERVRCRTALVRWALFACAMLAIGGDSDVVRKRVTQGVEQYRKAKYSNAAKAFADAELLSPKNLTVKFNRACAEARIRNRADAMSLYRQAAATRDPKLAAAAHYNLGSLEALEAQGVFGGSPENASKADRERGMEHLADAVSHFRTSLNADPSRSDARRNIEVIRAWQAKMRKVWKEKDQQKEQQQQEPEESLTQVLVRLDKAQHAAFEKNSIRGTRPDKSTLLQLQSEASSVVPDLKEKVGKQFASTQQVPEDQQEAVEQARQLFEQLARQVETATDGAVTALDGGKVDESIGFQVDALDRVNEMYAMVGQFPEHVAHALRLQQTLAGTEGVPAATEEVQIRGGNPLLERQSRVGLLAEQLPQKAKLFSEILERQAQQQPAQPQDAKAQERKDGYLTAVERAIELAPELNAAIESASKELLVQQVAAASPHMEEAYEILKKIAETLPEDDQRGGQGDQQENQDDGDKDSGDQEQPNPDMADEDEEQDRKDSQQQQEQQKQQEQEIRDKEAAEALMRQVRDREQEFKNLKEQLRAMRLRRSAVERDW